VTTATPNDEVSGRAALLLGPVSIGIQSIIYQLPFESVERSLAAVARSAQLVQRTSLCKSVSVYYGDCSPTRMISDAQLEKLRAQFGMHLNVHYHFFDSNLGSARGHNALASSNSNQMFVILNPDVLMAPRVLQILVEEFKEPGVGIVEAKQLPIEHPKDFLLTTGETSWVSTACAMVASSLFQQLRGFDADSFFLYCDDVDFSWRVRQAGYKAVYQPRAAVFHDKKLSPQAQWQTSSAERYYSAEAALILSYKWSRADLTQQFLDSFKASGEDYLIKAAKKFETMRRNGTLPLPQDPEHKIGQFIAGNYAKHRFAL